VGTSINTPTKQEQVQKRAWFLDLNPAEKSTLIATFGGWGLDGLDVMVYPFLISTLMALWHISPGQAGLLGTATLLISALGGWLAGLLSDKYGRTRVLQWTVIWFSVFTFLSGFTTSFWQLLITRGLQGLGFGGEWAVGAVLMGETIRAKHRGKAVGTVQSGWAIGWALAAIFYMVLFKIFPPETAWRGMFWIGILPAFLVFYIRRFVPEPDVFAKTKKRMEAQGESSHFLEIFSPTMLRTTLLTSLLATGCQGGYYAITTFLPTFLKTVRKLSVMNTGAYTFVAIAGAFAGYLVGAYLADYLGRKRSLILYASCSAITVSCYTFLPISNGVMLILGFPLGFFVSGSFSPIGSFFTELFPSRLRGSGQGFAYNFGRGVGALFPTLVGYLAIRITLGKAIAVFGVAAYLVMIIAVLLLPETKGKELKAYE
jgi:MFS family permease